MAVTKEWPLANPFISSLNMKAFFQRSQTESGVALVQCDSPTEVFDQISSPIVDCFGHKRTNALGANES